MIEKVFVQAEAGVPVDEAFHKAWHGFRKRRIPCDLVEEQTLLDGSLPLTRQTLVAGAIRVVEQAITQIGMRPPTANNLPEELRAYFGRRIQKTDLGQVRKQWRSQVSQEACFLKPLDKNKAFPAIALFDADDLRGLDRFADDTRVIVSEYVVFESEWRAFVVQGEVVGLAHYQGDFFQYPDRDTLLSAIRDFHQAPAGYGIDFGVLSGGRTVLIEANDGYSLGSYSLNSVDYSRLLEARWEELAA
ncbi:ATP-grasp domain-containing protein [Lignipirellula cremea]|uniref:ATP-grasp domain-containing protein n=1 Tax=Lignipirellula cremea TaxID=2528010 RepID=A0A518DZX9_9BACT|nr:ATP-grasp domain-containing protein [Lignipirellula cremea]QDU97385.1 hypothetical protein Pla8534_52310 [Lignipirellula cremea]